MPSSDHFRSGHRFFVRLLPAAAQTDVVTNLHKTGAQNANILDGQALQRQHIDVARQRKNFLFQGPALGRQENLNFTAVDRRGAPSDEAAPLHALQLLDGARPHRSNAVAQLALADPVTLPQAHEKIEHAYRNITGFKLLLHRLQKKAVGVAEGASNIEFARAIQMPCTRFREPVLDRTWWWHPNDLRSGKRCGSRGCDEQYFKPKEGASEMLLSGKMR